VIFHGLQPTAPGAVPVRTVSVVLSSCMDELTTAPHHGPVRVLPHNKRLDECFGDFLVRVVCECGTSRHIDPEALARIAWRSATLAALTLRAP
jgi:hypothetical protein